MQIKLQIKPLSVNSAWNGRRFKSDKYKAFESEMIYKLPNFKESIPEMIRIDFFFGFSSKLADIDNPIKMVTDCLQKKYGFNDRDIWEMNVRKSIVPKGEEFIRIGIHQFNPDCTD